MNSFLLLCDMFSFVFLKKLKTPKRHFEIIWPLANSVKEKISSNYLFIIGFIDRIQIPRILSGIFYAFHVSLQHFFQSPNVVIEIFNLFPKIKILTRQTGDFMLETSLCCVCWNEKQKRSKICCSNPTDLTWCDPNAQIVS